ncbi:GrpB family protein [Paenibacillus herberti]|uniref:GrpB family protein n=1 Tax=Paenibacillus herberti TaxID=1619309 RepID=A0A229P1G2_9BACL|nr:GrpB family protein [Paenibacillus herberti]OXM16096.1 hypothetical protein CGZ75_05180 [Paenibacillus herberti]
MDPAIIISDYQNNWAAEYEHEAERIRSALGALIIEIEHIGSTSIEGMAAKPLIDMMISVQRLDDVEMLVDPLAQLNYEYVHKPKFSNRLFFRKGPWRAGTHHLHVYAKNSKEWNQQLLFRNFMQANRDQAQAYMELKRELAIRYRHDRVSYTAGKDEFIRRILSEAKLN